MGKAAGFALVVLVLAGAFFLFEDDLTRGEEPAKEDSVTVKNTKPQIANDWFPKINWSSTNINANDLSLTAKSAIVVDYEKGEVVFAKDAKERSPVASTVKIMTALVALQNNNLDDIFSVSANAANIGENSMGLAEGEQLTLEELLYGMMLVSGNDAAITVAEGVSKNEKDFVILMNNEAKRLGLDDTLFISASGLDEDGTLQYSTPYDLATIAHFVWENYPDFRRIVSTEHIVLEENIRHKSFDLFNDTNLLTSYPGVKGMKPGFTWEAGLCLVTYAENDGKKLLAVILGSEDRRGEMVKLLDYGFAKYGIHVEHPGLDL